MTSPEDLWSLPNKAERVAAVLKRLSAAIEADRGEPLELSDCTEHLAIAALSHGRSIIGVDRTLPDSDGLARWRGVDVLTNAGTEEARHSNYQLTFNRLEVPFGNLFGETPEAAEALQEAYRQGNVEFTIVGGAVVEQSTLYEPL